MRPDPATLSADCPPRGPRLDAHCHSSASSGPVIAALGLIGVPESYSPPEQVYTLARARGMDFFTLTDHDTIAGALSLAERGFPGVILGEEVTVHFPEDRCRLHILVWMLTPELHEQIGTLNLRADVYAFAAWLREHNLPHALAHPLYQQNGRLTRRHLDRCALLFKGFETLNGAHSGSHRSALESYLTHLTPGRIHRLVQDHHLEPLWPRIWEKARTGGSDDHALLNIGRAWTSVEAAPGETIDAREFFRRVMAGRCSPGGAAGHSTLLAHQLSAVAAHFYTRRLAHKPGPVGRAIAAQVLKFAGIAAPRPSRLRLAADALRRKLSPRRRRAGPLLDALGTAFKPVLEKYPDLRARLDPAGGLDGVALGEHERMADFIADLHAALHRGLGSSAARAWARRDRAGLIDHLTSYAILESIQLPYLYSLFHQNRERRFVGRLAHDTATHPEHRPMRIMLFTDTLGDVNGVSRFIRNIADQARAGGHDFRVVTSTRFEVPAAENITNFTPVFATAMPRYEQLEIALPPIVRMLRHADRHQPDVIHISTPGPVGCIGFLAARMLRAPMLGVYHTDFPAYIDHLFDDPSMTWACSRFMRAFYAPFTNIFTRSRDYADSLTRLGMPGHRLVPLRPGIDTEAFHPRFRDPAIWDRIHDQHRTEPSRRAAGREPIRFLYCGRISVEKNMPLLSAVWRLAAPRLAELGRPAELILVGDGPFRGQMQNDLASTPARFLGFRHGEELSTLYASADAFLFPSITDTLGQVVIEAQASGLPVVVTDKGGPKEVTRDRTTGFVLRPDRAEDWADRIIHLATDTARRAEMSAAAHQWAQGLSIKHSFEHFWRVHHEAWIEHIRGADDEPARPDPDPAPAPRAGRPDASPVE